MDLQKQFSSILKFVFPVEIVENFDIIDIKEISAGKEEELHFYFEENNLPPTELQDKQLRPNGFYDASEIKDFPLRDKKAVLHIKRRRWIDNDGKSYSRQWNFTAEGTKYSKEFAFFFKECFGHLPNSSSIA
ncbi:MAG: hypothetical protein LBI45_05570 [Bacteroidales bacterium]|jgi:hypothetical protein|nr:hypothetical protein [Bacteroidales bacterium]